VYRLGTRLEFSPLTALDHNRLHRVVLLLGGVHEQVVSCGRSGPAGPFQRYGAKGFNSAPCNAGDFQRPSAAVVDLQWPRTAVVDFEWPSATVVDFQWSGATMVDLKWSGTAVVDLEWPSAPVVGFG